MAQSGDPYPRSSLRGTGQTKQRTRFIDKQVWWWNEDVQRIVKEKKMAFNKWREINNTVDYEQYNTKKSAAKRAVAKAKTTHCDQQYADLDTPGGENEICRLANSQHRATQDIGKVKCIKSDDHQILRDPPAILRRCSEPFSSNCNTEFPHPPITSADPIA
jgi:hypothetical protein